MKDNEDIRKMDFEKFETDRLEEINYKLVSLSQMSFTQSSFLNGLIRYYKPKKILEVGVAAGGSSAVILNAIKDIDGSMLYSIDYSTEYHQDASKLSGFLITEQFKDISGGDKWKLYTGGTAACFMDEIGGDIDLCLLDAAHINPGEFLDYLMVLPYLKKNAIVVLHDIQLQTIANSVETCCILYSGLSGIKLYPKTESLKFTLPNIGAVVLDDNAMDRTFNTFCLLTLKWQYMITPKDYIDILNIFSKYYSKELINIYTSSYVEHLKASLSDNSSINENRLSTVENSLSTVENSLSTVENSILKLINTIAWWIPIKKWRDKFKAKFNK